MAFIMGVDTARGSTAGEGLEITRKALIHRCMTTTQRRVDEIQRSCHLMNTIMVAVTLLGAVPIHIAQPETEALRLIGKALGTLGGNDNVHLLHHTDLVTLIPFRPKIREKNSSPRDRRPR